MQTDFEIAGGSIPGGDHLQRQNLLVGKNNQDAWCTHQDPRVTIAIVSDGCGSQARSEVGANVGSQLLRTALLRQWSRHAGMAKTSGFEKALPLALEATRQDVLAHLRILSQAIAGDGSFSQAICDNFLFTLVGGLVTEYGAAFFTIGDGLIIVNGEDWAASAPTRKRGGAQVFS
jgi:serine/threonine protein phosphatase PrpC